jgi:hypothetical protein
VLPYEINIPEPSPADTENVITALETAAVFRSKGDGYEAIRWLRRAAECAGEAGDDERALALSRSLADLSEELDSELTRVGLPLRHEPPSPQRLPTPPPSARAAPSPSGSSQPGPPPPPSSRARQVAPTPPPSTPTTAHTGTRNAARVAIAPSTTGPGVFEIRILADDEAPGAGSSEAVVVMLDPGSTLLEARSRS